VNAPSKYACIHQVHDATQAGVNSCVGYSGLCCGTASCAVPTQLDCACSPTPTNKRHHARCGSFTVLYMNTPPRAGSIRAAAHACKQTLRCINV